VTTKEKNELLDSLSVCYHRINFCKILCEENDRTEEAKQLERREKRLKIEIDGLLRDLYHNWIGDAKQLKGKLDGINKEINEHIEKIEQDIKTTQKIVKAIGYFDDAIKIATDLVL
jgi:predicted DNA-binding transcriptional regulator